MSQETMFETTATLEIKARQRARPSYVFRLDETQASMARQKGLPDSALIALAAITAAAFGDRSASWVTLSDRTMTCFDRGFRWWHRATSQLVAADLIECQRHPGRLPRYRLKEVKVSVHRLGLSDLGGERFLSAPPLSLAPSTS